jgi:hypothetical protein
MTNLEIWQDNRRMHALIKKKKGDPGYQKEYHWMTRYGITSKEYDRLFKLQNGKCALCSRSVNKCIRRNSPDYGFHIDHKHVDGYDELPISQKSQYVRGLLCYRCNIFADFIETEIEFQSLVTNWKNYIKNPPFMELCEQEASE